MRTIEINIYTPKEIYEMIKTDVKMYGGAWLGLWKSRKIRKKYNITFGTMCSELAKMDKEDADKFIACFPKHMQDKMYFLVHGKFKSSVPKGEFR